MKPITWNAITDEDAWTKTLRQILDAAAKASDANDDAERLDICDVLNEFIRRSAPNTDRIKELDRLAGEAIDEMAEAIAAAAIGRIAQRTAALTGLAKEVDRVSAKAAESAATLRLDKFHAAIDALTDAERAVATLTAVYESGTDDQLKAQIAELLKTIAKAKTALEKGKT